MFFITEYTHMAFTLEKVFAKLRAKYLETDLSSDEEMYIDMSYQQHLTTKKRRRSNSDEKENNKEFKTPGKRGRKKKVGRKPKEPKMEGEVLQAEKPKKNHSGKLTGKGNKLNSKSNRGRKKKKSPLKEFDIRDEEFQEKLYGGEESSPDDKEDCKESLNEAQIPAVCGTGLEVDEEEEDEAERDDEDDDDDYEDHPLLVREDPFPEDDDELDNLDSPTKNSFSDSIARKTELRKEKVVAEPPKVTVPKRKPGRPRKDANLKAAVITQVYNTNREVSHQSESGKRAAVTVCKYSDDYEEDQPVKESDVLLPPDEEEELEEELEEKEEIVEEEDIAPTTTTDRLEPSSRVVTDDDDDDDDDMEPPDVCIYYRNDNYQSSEEERDEAKAKKDYMNKRQNELFGEIDDLDEDEDDQPDQHYQKYQHAEKNSRDHSDQHSSSHRSKHSSKRKDKDRKKHKHGDKHHHHHHSSSHHHHHHHHKSKSKDGKHHHKKKDKKHSDKENSRKVLKVEEVYECSEEDPNSRDVGGGLEQEEAGMDDPSLDENGEGELVTEECEEEDHNSKLLDNEEHQLYENNGISRRDDDMDDNSGVNMMTSESETTSPSKKKKSKHKSKHHSKHGKHKDGKFKDGKSKNRDSKTKESKNKDSKVKDGKNKLNKSKDGKKKSSKNNKKKKLPENMKAIDALSAATEQSLKVSKK